MKNRKFRILIPWMLLCLLLLPCRAQAATLASGTCGNDLTWTLTDDGKLIDLPLD